VLTHGFSQLPRARQRDSAAGYDFTFSPVKSFSVLWALAPRDLAKTLEDIHDQAVADTLEYIENNMVFTRMGAQGVAQLDTDGVIATAFTHRDSRAGDPDLHTHLTVSNKVRARGHDGIYRWLALDGRPLFKGNGWLLRGDQGGVALDDPRAPVAGLRYFRLVAGDPPGARPHSPLTSCESRRARRTQPGRPHGR
jgi:hypothetical protein